MRRAARSPRRLASSNSRATERGHGWRCPRGWERAPDLRELDREPRPVGRPGVRDHLAVARGHDDAASLAGHERGDPLARERAVVRRPGEREGQRIAVGRPDRRHVERGRGRADLAAPEDPDGGEQVDRDPARPAPLRGADVVDPAEHLGRGAARDVDPHDPLHIRGEQCRPVGREGLGAELEEVADPRIQLDGAGRGVDHFPARREPERHPRSVRRPGDRHVVVRLGEAVDADPGAVGPAQRGGKLSR
jgi:hypothetical protein